LALPAWAEAFLRDDPTGELACDQVAKRAFAEWASGTFLVWALPPA
jgi:hypothetical protein